MTRDQAIEKLRGAGIYPNAGSATIDGFYANLLVTALVALGVLVLDPPEPTLVEKLRVIAALKPGDEMPKWMVDEHGWAGPLGAICAAAADTIDATVMALDSFHLRSNPPSFIKQEGIGF